MSEIQSEGEQPNFSIVNNQHVYYQIQDPVGFLSSIKEFILAERALPPNKRTFKPSDELVYRVGLILKTVEGSTLQTLYDICLGYLPPPLAYGALWYCDTDDSRKILVQESNLKTDAKRAELASQYLKAKRPEPGRFNPLVSRISTNDKVGFFQELWAGWFAQGTQEALISILENMERETVKRCIALCEGKTQQQISDFYNTYLRENEARFDESMLVGSLAYDTKMLTMAKSIVFAGRALK